MSLFQHVIYKTYAMFIFSTLCTFSISQFMNIVLYVDNSDEFTDSLYMLLSVFVAGYKQVYMWINRRKIMVVINILTEKPFAICEIRETIIQQKFEKMVENNTLRYLSMVTMAILSIVLMSIFTAFTNKNLTYKAWVPFDYSSPAIYLFVYIYQLLGMATSGIVNVACESIICGLLLYICCQFEILEHRLTKVTHDQHILHDCIRHHNLIFQYARTVNNMFSKIIALQFAVSMLVLCSNLYRIATTTNYVIFISLLVYTGAILTQIFIYCWFGNEVKTKSLRLANNIFNKVEWLTLNNNCKKDLLLIMKRTTIPIEFNSMYILTLNLDSFVALLKMSYSAFNLLHQTQETQVVYGASELEKKVQMRVLKFTFLICAFAGCWQPSSWTSLLKHIIYKTYAMFLFSALCTFSISQFMNIILYVDNSDEFTDSLYMMLTVFVAGYKQVYLWIDRKKVMVVINALIEKPFAICEIREATIQQKFEKIVENNTLRYLSMVTMAIISVVLMSIFTVFTKKNLTYKAWVPFDYSSPAIYLFVYFYQLLGMATSGIVNVACESIICGLLLYICCQFEILEHRLTKVTHDQHILHECIRHHNLIFQYARTVNNMFSEIIALQFAVSMLVLCSNLYRIATTSNYIIFISLLVYTGAILAQIFIYCWFGNEVKTKSLHLANNIFNNVEWPTLSNNCKKDLLLIMKRSTIPIEFSSMYIMTLNLDSFVALLKMSYSAFNLLHQTHE
ncbi:uncharacterized protein [Anoplolepis gracilipes]|uniref:uncharacterized protein n=1 Tax=Anoplolepis gracilipes TaxID=354296 RepID=UPI003BA0F3F7